MALVAAIGEQLLRGLAVSTRNPLANSSSRNKVEEEAGPER
jgi:hypothetical protein